MQAVHISICHHRKNVPCLGCSDRFIGCHSTCEKYKEWSKEDKKNHDAALIKKKENDLFVDYLTKSIEKSKRK